MKVGELMISIGENIESYRKILNVSQKELAEGIISRSQLSHIEQGHSNTSNEVIYKLFVKLVEITLLKKKSLDRIPSFDELSDYDKYNQFNELLDWYSINQDEKDMTHIDICDVCSIVMKDDFGLLEFFVYQLIGDNLQSKDMKHDALDFYLRGYYSICNSGWGYIKQPIIIRYLSKVVMFGFAANRYFSVIEVLEYIDLTINKYQIDMKFDYLYNLALAYKKVNYFSKAYEICHRVLMLASSDDVINVRTLGKTYHLLSVLNMLDGKDEISHQNSTIALSIFNKVDAFNEIDKLLKDRKDGIIL